MRGLEQRVARTLCAVISAGTPPATSQVFPRKHPPAGRRPPSSPAPSVPIRHDREGSKFQAVLVVGTLDGGGLAPEHRGAPGTSEPSGRTKVTPASPGTPGNRQRPRSRRTSVLRIRRGTVRDCRPTPRGRPSASSTRTATIESHARRRAVSAETRPTPWMEVPTNVSRSSRTAGSFPEEAAGSLRSSDSAE